MLSEFEPKRYKLVKLSLDEVDIELLRCWVLWTKRDLKSGHCDYSRELRNFIDECDDLVKEFQGGDENGN